MTHNGLPVHGYQPQSDAKVALVNEFKQDEERLLRKIDTCRAENMTVFNTPNAMGYVGEAGKEFPFDESLLYEAEGHLRIGFMLLNRAVFQPQRISLPEDAPAEAAE